MADAETIIHLLEDMKDILEYSLENNEYTRIVFAKVHRNLAENSIPEESYDSGDAENMKEAGKDRYFEDTESLENILHEKLQENARLKALNGRLLMDTRQKSQKIKELTRAISLQGQLVQNSKAISSYKDKLERCNVEIQKLRKELKLENKKLQNERSRSLRQETLTEKSQDKLNTVKSVSRGTSKNVEGYGTQRASPSPSLDQIWKSVEGKGTQRAAASPSLEKLNEDHFQSLLQMIELQKEPSIQDETLDMPESLDSDLDEKCQCA